MNRIRTITVSLFAICLILAVSTALAQGDMFAASMCDMYRINTETDISIVLQKDVSAAQQAEPGEIVVKELSGEEIYTKISELISLGGESYPYFSGISAELKTAIGEGGIRRDSVERLLVGGAEIVSDRMYSVSLGENAAQSFQAAEVKKAYVADNKLLYKYVNGFVSKQESAQGEGQTQENTSSDGNDIVKRQTPVLWLALGLLAVAVLLYFILKKKKMQH